MVNKRQHKKKPPGYKKVLVKHWRAPCKLEDYWFYVDYENTTKFITNNIKKKRCKPWLPSISLSCKWVLIKMPTLHQGKTS